MIMNIMEGKQEKLTREEKIAKFDELRRNYSAMMKSLKFYEGECAKLTNTDSQSIKVETKEQGTLISEDHSKERSKDEGKWKMDADLPTGWRYSEHSTTQHTQTMKTSMSILHWFSQVQTSLRTPRPEVHFALVFTGRIEN